MLLDDVHPGPLRPDGKLIGGGGPEGISGAQQHPLALALPAGGQLSDGGGLAHAVDADEQHHSGGAAHIHPGVAHREDFGQNFLHAGLGPIGVLDLIALAPLLKLLHGLHGGLRPHIRHDQRLLQLVVEVVIQFGKAVENSDLSDFIKKTHVWSPLMLFLE